MLDYSFFYDLAKYCNDTWKGCFTEKEIAENEYEYLVSYEDSIKDGTPNYNIQSLIHNLQDDVENDPDSESSDYLIMLTSEFEKWNPCFIRMKLCYNSYMESYTENVMED